MTAWVIVALVGWPLAFLTGGALAVALRDAAGKWLVALVLACLAWPALTAVTGDVRLASVLGAWLSPWLLVLLWPTRRA